MAMRLIDLTGERFGRLVVMHRALSKQRRNYYWWCRCDCGRMKRILGQSLRSGATVSCGCRLQEHRQEFGTRAREFAMRARGVAGVDNRGTGRVLGQTGTAPMSAGSGDLAPQHITHGFVALAAKEAMSLRLAFVALQHERTEGA
jgi:hypothetical protein